MSKNHFWYAIVSLKLWNSYLKIDHDLSALFQFFEHIEKSWLKNTSQIVDEDDYRFENQNQNHFHFFFETNPVSWKYFTFFPHFLFFPWFFFVKTRVIGQFLWKKWGFNFYSIFSGIKLTFWPCTAHRKRCALWK